MRLGLIPAAAAVAVMTFAGATPAAAGGDAALAGVAGFAVGTLFGNAVARPRYVAPAPVYVAPAPVYVAPPPPPEYVRPAPAYFAAVPEPWSPEWYAWCGSRYRSFDARSGTFMDYDGYRKFCQ